MNRIIIYSITIFGALLGFLSLENRKIPINRSFQSIQNAYYNLLKCSSKIRMACIKLLMGIVLLFAAVFSYERSCFLLGSVKIVRIYLLMGCIFTILVIVLYFLFGIPLLIFSKIENLMPTVKTKYKLSFQFLVSSFIQVVYLFFLLYMPKSMRECGKAVLIGLMISYFINMVMLIHISIEPLICCHCKYRKEKIEEKYPLKIVLAGALILIMLIVLNLYLGVVMIANLYDQAYLCSNITGTVSYFDLFYYTVISFTTIGYGDIVPYRIESKCMAIVIAATSVMCLVIFVSSILALKDKLTG